MLRKTLAGAALAAALAGCGTVPAEPRPAEPQVPAAQAVAGPVALVEAPAPPAPRVVGRPTSLVLPSLRVRARVVPIAATGGELTPPPDPLEAGWWDGGSPAGSARGATLLTGHTVHTGGGALDDLEKARPGDRAVVRTDRGAIRYTVSSVRVLSKARLAKIAPVLFGASGAGRLVVVTCEDYNWSTGHYASNVVVVATPEM